MSTTTARPYKSASGDDLLAAVKVGKRSPARFDDAVDEIDYRTTKRNGQSLPLTAPVAEAVAILAKRGVPHVEPAFGVIADAAERVEHPEPEAEKVDAFDRDGLVKNARKLADKVAAEISENTGRGFVKCKIEQHKLLVQLGAEKYLDTFGELAD